MKEQNYEEADIIPHNWYESNESRLKQMKEYLIMGN